MNVCKLCGETDPDAFYPHWKSRCKRCIQAGRKEYAQVYNKTYHRQVRSWALTLKKYGITEEDYNVLLEKQEGRCAICRCWPHENKGKGYQSLGDKGWARLAVDHDHLTGIVRGLLCINCNLAVGYLADDAGRAEALADYLRGGGSS